MSLLQRKYIYDEPTDAEKSGELYSGFKQWVRRNYVNGVAEEDWESILREDDERVPECVRGIK